VVGLQNLKIAESSVLTTLSVKFSVHVYFVRTYDLFIFLSVRA